MFSDLWLFLLNWWLWKTVQQTFAKCICIICHNLGQCNSATISCTTSTKYQYLFDILKARKLSFEKKHSQMAGLACAFTFAKLSSAEFSLIFTVFQISWRWSRNSRGKAGYHFNLLSNIWSKSPVDPKTSLDAWHYFTWL